MLTGAHSPRRIWEMATNDWGLRTRQRKKIGGGPLALSAIYGIFANPFYAGVIAWHGRSYPGKHEPMITLDEFDRVQAILGRRSQPRPKRHTFPYTGLIRCGGCGSSVTAERKVNRHGSEYTYYHCTWRHTAPKCAERSVTAEALEEALVEFLSDLRVHPSVLSVIGKGEARRDRELAVAAQEQALDRETASVAKQLENLTRLRVRDQISDDTFAKEQARLEREQLRVAQARTQLAGDASTFEPLRGLEIFRTHAASWLRAGDDTAKRLIATAACSNPVLADRRLKVSAVFPFVRRSPQGVVPELRARGEDVRTLLREPEVRDVIDRVMRAVAAHETQRSAQVDEGQDTTLAA